MKTFHGGLPQIAQARTDPPINPPYFKINYLKLTGLGNLQLLDELGYGSPAGFMQ